MTKRASIWVMLSKYEATISLSFPLPKYMLGRSFLSHWTVNEGNFVLLLGFVRCMSSETIWYLQNSRETQGWIAFKKCVYPTQGLEPLPNNSETINSEVLFVLYIQTHTGMSDVSMWFILGLLWHCRLPWRQNGAIVQQKISVLYIIITWHVILFNPLSEKVSHTRSCVFLTRYTASHERTFVFLFFYRFVKQSCLNLSVDWRQNSTWKCMPTIEILIKC